MKEKLLSLISAALVIIATVVSSSTSWWVLYQPKAPKTLKK